MNKLIFKALELLDYYSKKLNISYDDENKYYSIIVNTREYLEKNNVSISVNERKDICDYLLLLEIPSFKQNIALLFKTEIENIKNEYDFCLLNKMSDNMLLGYLLYVLGTITYNQNNNLLLLKYNIAIWNTGFHNLARVCRGKIVDIVSHDIVVYPFDKFFNLNENKETDEIKIEHLIDKADYIYTSEKMDGSMVAVTKYNNKLLFTTNGSFENDMTKWSEEIIKKEYPLFYKECENGYTYIFELIHPSNRIVIDYGDIKELYLLGIRNVKTKRLLSFDEIDEKNKKFNFTRPAVYNLANKNDFQHIVRLAHKLKNANREGWVIRIGHDNTETIIKLKLEEYFALHKMFDRVTLGWTYKRIVANDLDDFIAICNEDQKKSIDEKLVIIENVKNKIKQEVIEEANTYLEKYGIKHEEFCNNVDIMKKIIAEVFLNHSDVCGFVVQYLKNPVKLDYSVDRMFYKNIRYFFEKYGLDPHQ